MKKFELITSVSQGKFLRNRTTILNAIKSFENSDVILTLEKPKKKRSNAQNRYYYGMLIPLMQQGAKDLFGEVWSATKAHEHLKAKFLFHESVNIKTGEIIQTPKSTTENTTIEMEVYHTEIRIYLLQDFDINAPEPNEEILLKI